MAVRPIAIIAGEAPARPPVCGFPADLAGKLAGREKRPLGDLSGLANFGVKLTRLAPGAASSMRHAHSRQDEFVYILEGAPDPGRRTGAGDRCRGDAAGARQVRRLRRRHRRCAPAGEPGRHGCASAGGRLPHAA